MGLGFTALIEPLVFYVGGVEGVRSSDRADQRVTPTDDSGTMGSHRQGENSGKDSNKCDCISSPYRDEIQNGIFCIFCHLNMCELDGK